MIELVCRIEDEFGIVAPAEAPRLATVEDVVDNIDRLAATEGAAGDALSAAA